MPEPRHLIAYALIALMLLAGAGAIWRAIIQRRRRREMRRRRG
ncbi:hypothetical protein [Sphingomonas flavalba]|nr:hypothetical protein [Sphingomonas flavalba]